MQVLDLQHALLRWFDEHRRALPWRVTDAAGQRDPYRVWVSEILLQQTQVSRGTQYFDRFLAQFPDVHALAAASQEAVLKAWEGCGYYARARNLHVAAQQVALSGFPSSYEGWLEVRGVGPYTAAAISSLAYGEARAVNDGNVRRVLARLYAQSQPDAVWVQTQADALLDLRRPGDWNEALMDLGATICTPKSPDCPRCPLSTYCQAWQQGQPALYPAPKVRPAKKEVRGVLLIVGDAQQVYLEQRSGTLLGGLYGLPVEELIAGELQPDAALIRLIQRLGLDKLGVDTLQVIGEVQHTMTHRHIQMWVYALPAAKHLPLEAVKQRPLARLDHKALALLNAVQPTLF